MLCCEIYIIITVHHEDCSSCIEVLERWAYSRGITAIGPKPTRTRHRDLVDTVFCIEG